ncbi:MAG: beta-ketoacyl-[acyl-carrier-protein] synthase family protein [Candidatus Cyclobacteriaceae bacterium M2_1C_046]
MSRIFITGLGAISAIGNSVEENRDALINERSGLSHLQLLDSSYGDKLFFGEIKTEDQQFKEKLNAYEKGVTRTSLLALQAIREAIEDSHIDQKTLSSSETALIGANTVGGMCLTEQLFHDANSREEGSEYLSSYDNGSVTLYLQEKLKIGGISNTLNTACSSSANSIIYGARLLKHGYGRRAIVGGVDSLAKFTINGFNSLRILSPEKCKPFDEDRQGLNLGEGAAFLVLEREEDIKGKRIYAELTGFFNANDSFHASSLSDEGTGPLLAMNGALQMSGLNPEDISYVNAHGTGTENNDLVESLALAKIFNHIPFSSTKSFIGHTLGAAGAVEAVYSILSISNQEVYPNLNFEKPISGPALKPVTNYQKQKVEQVLSNSFGFGGNCSSLIFSKI